MSAPFSRVAIRSDCHDAISLARYGTTEEMATVVARRPPSSTGR
jgi:hypothetical protein